MATEKFFWWQTGIIYQVYPRSFQDSDGDGIGDIRGIIGRLGYLQWLGVTAIWVSPIYPSPMADFGYDISDYRGIHPVFGAMSDFDDLLREAHKVKIRVILDLVPNHTSDAHPWFVESRSARDNPRRSWYLWHDPVNGDQPPNNWLSVFGGPAWEWDDTTKQFYYHAFLKEQPDLNWRNAEVQNAMFEIMRFWLDKGVDGFRVDVMWHMIKDEALRDNPENPEYQEYMPTYEKLLPVFSTDQPEVHDIVQKMRKIVDGYDDRLLIGEIYLPIHKLVTYYGNDNDGAHLPFNFMLVSLAWEAESIAAMINEYEGALPRFGWPNWVLSNHDQPRITSRAGMQQARVAAMLLLTLRGTPTIYYGDEIAMQDVPIPFEEVQDPQGINMADKNLSRDPARTPMQWDDSAWAGFTTGKPWLRLGASYRRYNVETEKNDKYSMLQLYRRLIRLRQTEPALMSGEYKPVYADRQAIAYIRHREGENSFLVVLNLSHRPCYLKMKDTSIRGKVVLSASGELEGSAVYHAFHLAGDEGVIVQLTDTLPKK